MPITLCNRARAPPSPRTNVYMRVVCARALTFHVSSAPAATAAPGAFLYLLAGSPAQQPPAAQYQSLLQRRNTDNAQTKRLLYMDRVEYIKCAVCRVLLCSVYVYVFYSIRNRADGKHQRSRPYAPLRQHNTHTTRPFIHNIYTEAQNADAASRPD